MTTFARFSAMDGTVRTPIDADVRSGCCTRSTTPTTCGPTPGPVRRRPAGSPTTFVDRFGIVGPPEHCIAALRELADLGHRPFHRRRPVDRRRPRRGPTIAVRTFADEVLPRPSRRLSRCRHDLVIRGGTRWSTAPARRAVTADVAVDGDRIAAVGDVGAGRAHHRRRRRRRDARASSTSTPTTTARPRGTSGSTPSSWHGVTTVVMGNCGVGFAPVRADDHERLIELMEGVEDIPGAALHEGLSLGVGVLRRVPRRGRPRPPRHRRRRAGAPRRAPALRDGRARRRPRAGHGRGDRRDGAAGRRGGATAGALGFTTSRTRNHRTSRGELDAHAHRRRRRAGRHRRGRRSRRQGRAPGRLRLRRPRRRARRGPRHGRGVRSAAVDLGRPGAHPAGRLAPPPRRRSPTPTSGAWP